MTDDCLIYAHIGDLHLTTDDQANYTDLRAIVSEIASLADVFDFVYVPGDNADNGLAAQYKLAGRELGRLAIPVHIVTGDHDMEQGTLDNFYSALDTAPLPKAVDTGGVRCLFLDLCGTGTGGPDFRVGAKQAAWLADELKQAARDERRCAIFMHTYPADLRGEGETAAINAAFAAREVLLVDMGHTHYNELANDGRTIFAATRSTGQIEEGPVGYSIVTIDRRTVSWRFRESGASLPVVLITAPADRRLANDADDPDHVPPRAACEIRASVLGGGADVTVTCRVDGGETIAMRSIGGSRYGATITLAADARTIAVHAETSDGRVGHETIEIATKAHLEAERHADGSDADSIGAWVERGILGTQLGPNRNGKGWSS